MGHHDDLVLRAEPDTTLVAFGVRDGAGLDADAVAGALWSRRWYVDRQAPPPSLHCSVNAVHEPVLDEFLVDLDAAIDSVRGDASPGAARAYGTVG